MKTTRENGYFFMVNPIVSGGESHKKKKENRLEVSKASILYTKTLEVYGGNLLN